MPTGVPSALQQAAPVSVPSSPKAMAFMPPPMRRTLATSCPRRASSLATSSGNPSSISTMPPSVQIRGASTASWSVIPWSRRLTSACSAEGKIRSPPGRPSACSSRPSRRTIIGAIEVNTRLPGSIESARPGCGSKLNM